MLEAQHARALVGGNDLPRAPPADAMQWMRAGGKVFGQPMRAAVPKKFALSDAIGVGNQREASRAAHRARRDRLLRGWTQHGTTRVCQ
jgi:hypothetical protein